MHEEKTEFGNNIENHLTGNHAEKKKKGKSPVARRVGYAFGIFFSLLCLWVISNIDNWGWRFITDEWSQVAGIVRTSIIVDVICYGLFMIIDFKVVFYIGKLVMDVFSFLVGVRMFQVFPFDFSGGWGWLNGVLPVVIILGLVAVGIAFVVRTAKLAAGKEIYD
jgi:hypothetical protein